MDFTNVQSSLNNRHKSIGVIGDIANSTITCLSDDVECFRAGVEHR